MRIIIASGNPHKINEIRMLLFWPGVEWKTPADAPGTPSPEETGVTFAENAAIKARALAAHTGWLGAGTFKELLGDLALDGLATSFVNPGYVYNPTLHEPPEPTSRFGVEPADRADQFAASYPALADLAVQIAIHAPEVQVALGGQPGTPVMPNALLGVHNCQRSSMARSGASPSSHSGR